MTVTPEQRLEMAKAIIDFEARRDSRGHLKVYHLPPNDGGGRYEVAGINERYDGPAVRKLVALLEARKYDEAESYAAEYIAGNTDFANKITQVPAINSYVRDSIFNRGVAGAVKIIQIALKFRGSKNDHRDIDGEFGPKTTAALREAEKNPEQLLNDLRAAREKYEREWVGYRANFWNGLVNRWNGALDTAKKFGY